MRGEIKSLQQRLDTTTVYVTHDQVEAMTMADKIVVMRDGAIEQVGRPLDLYDRPANQFVAGFIGSPAMNFLPGRLDGAVFHTDDGLVFPVGDDWRGLPAQRAIYGARPEHMDVSPDGEAVEVVVVEPTGSETEVVVRKGATEFNCLFRTRVTLDRGQTIRIRPDPAFMHLFHPETGCRLG